MINLLKQSCEPQSEKSKLHHLDSSPAIQHKNVQTAITPINILPIIPSSCLDGVGLVSTDGFAPVEVRIDTRIKLVQEVALVGTGGVGGWAGEVGL